ncbi:MAG: TadE/TadG family type IV pilus assembly protein [Sedimenticola sp.]
MNSGSPQRERGAALIEFALVVPLLVMLVLGITELGHALFEHNTLQKAVSAGARYLGRSYDGLDTNDCSTGANWSTAVSRAGNLVLYGHIDGASTTTGDDSSVTNNGILPNVSSDMISVTLRTDSDTGLCVIQLAADVEYTPIFASIFDSGEGLLRLPSFSLYAAAEERFIGE